MEEVYGEKSSGSVRYRECSYPKSTRFLSHQCQHKPVLDVNDHHIPHSQSKYCMVRKYKSIKNKISCRNVSDLTDLIENC